MEPFFALVGLAFGVAVAAIPVVGLLWALKTRRRVALLERKVGELEARLFFTEQRFDRGAIGNLQPEPLQRVAAPPVRPTPAEVSRELPSLEVPPPEKVPEPLAPPPPVALPSTAAKADQANSDPSLRPVLKAPFDWEGLVSVRLFAWLGGVTLFVSAAFFLHYSIQHELIAPPVRVAIGLVLGAVAFFLGDWLRTKADRAGQAVSGAGVGTLYASLFAARSLYHLFSAPVTLVGLVAVTVLAGVMAVRRNAYMVAVLGTLGGFLTPLLLSSGENRPVALFAYLTLLSVGLVVVAQRRQWASILVFGLSGSALVFVGWCGQYLDASNVPIALVGVALLAAVFAFLAPSSGKIPQIIATVAAVSPLVVSVVFAGMTSLHVAPATLVPYLLVVSAGAVIANRQVAPLPLVPIAAALCTLTLWAVDPVEAVQPFVTLLLFALVPGLYAAVYAWRRQQPDARLFRLALAVTLFGSWLVTTRWHLRLDTLEVAGVGYFALLPLALFAAVHVVGLIAVGLEQRRGGWLAAAQSLALAHLIVLCSVRFGTSRTTVLLTCVLTSLGTFWALPLLAPRARFDRWGFLSGMAALVLHFPFVYGLAETPWGTTGLGAFAVGCGALALVLVERVRRSVPDPHPDRQMLLTVGGAVTLLFVTTAIPILFVEEWITIGWALEMATIVWLFRRIPHRGLIAASAGLAVMVVLRLVANPFLWAYHPRSDFLILNWYLYTFSLPAGFFLYAAQRLSKDPVATRYRYPASLRLAAGVLGFFLINTEIADAYSTGEEITFRLVGGTVLEDLTYSIAWGVFALVLLGFGLVRRSRPVRLGGMAVLLLTIGKVFFHDLWHLGALYRVASFFGLAVSLLAVSFLTQRFLTKKAKLPLSEWFFP